MNDRYNQNEAPRYNQNEAPREQAHVGAAAYSQGDVRGVLRNRQAELQARIDDDQNRLTVIKTILDALEGERDKCASSA